MKLCVATLIVGVLLISLAHAQAPPAESPVKAHRADQIAHDPDGSAFFTAEDDVKKALNALGDAVGSGGPGGGCDDCIENPVTENVDFSSYSIIDVRRLEAHGGPGGPRAASGAIGISNNYGVCWRTAADTTDYCFYLNDSDQFSLYGGANLLLGGDSIIVEGSTDDPYETTLTFTDPTADRTITIPDADGALLVDVIDDTTPQLGGSLDGENNAISDISSLDVNAHATDGGALILKEGLDDTGGNTFKIAVPDTGLTGDGLCTVNADGTLPIPGCVNTDLSGSSFTDVGHIELTGGSGSPASFGGVRLKNLYGNCWRNSTDSGDACLYLDGSDVFQLVGTLAVSGGLSFTGDLDLSNSDILDGGFIELVGASGTPASFGGVRLKNSYGTCWRNAADSGDLCIYLDGSNDFQITNDIVVAGGASFTADVDLQNNDLLDGGYVELVGASGTPASFGGARFKNSYGACWRNAADDGDLCLYLDGSDDFQITSDLVVGGKVAIGTTSGVEFEGAITDAYETTLEAAGPVGTDRTITLPDKDGTVLLDLADDITPQLSGDLDGDGQAITGVSSVDVDAHATDGASIVLKEGVDDGVNTFQIAVPNSGLTSNGLCTVNADGTLPITGCISTDLGNSHLTSGGYVELDTSGGGGPYANNGHVRMANGAGTCWRNAGDTTDICLYLDSGDDLTLLGTADLDLIDSASILGAKYIELDWDGGGSPVAGSGHVRMANGAGTCWRNNADSTDQCLYVNSSDELTLLNIGTVKMDASDVTVDTLDIDDASGGIPVQVSYPEECIWLKPTDASCPAVEGCTPTTREWTSHTPDVSEETLLFDADEQNAYWNFHLPKNFVGSTTLEVTIAWSTPDYTASTSDDLCMQLGAVYFTPGSSTVAGFTPYDFHNLYVEDSTGAVNRYEHASAATLTISPGAPSADEMVMLGIMRETTASKCATNDDNISTDVHVYGAQVCYEVNNVFSGE